MIADNQEHEGQLTGLQNVCPIGGQHQTEEEDHEEQMKSDQTQFAHREDALHDDLHGGGWLDIDEVQGKDGCSNNKSREPYQVFGWLFSTQAQEKNTRKSGQSFAWIFCSSSEQSLADHEDPGYQGHSLSLAVN